jgi:hypothetical protein
MRTERRVPPRWRAASHKHQVRLRCEDGRTVSGTILDLCRSGLGLRVDRNGVAVGMRVRVTSDLPGETVDIRGVVSFVDRFFPHVGLRMESDGLMERLVAKAEAGGFLMSEGRGDTLALAGSLTLAAIRELDTAADFRKLDLSRVGEVSVAGAGIVSMAAGRGARIDCCSEAIAPLFDSLGICKAGLCCSATPCDLPKAWPTGRGSSG